MCRGRRRLGKRVFDSRIMFHELRGTGTDACCVLCEGWGCAVLFRDLIESEDQRILLKY